MPPNGWGGTGRLARSSACRGAAGAAPHRYVWVKDTLPWAKAETGSAQGSTTEIPAALPRRRVRASHHGRGLRADELGATAGLFAISQAGLVEKFVDALVWALFPVFLVTQGAT